MTIAAWFQAAIADAERRGLPELKPMLETLAKATQAPATRSPFDLTTLPSNLRR